MKRYVWLIVGALLLAGGVMYWSATRSVSFAFLGDHKPVGTATVRYFGWQTDPTLQGVKTVYNFRADFTDVVARAKGELSQLGIPLYQQDHRSIYFETWFPPKTGRTVTITSDIEVRGKEREHVPGWVLVEVHEDSRQGWLTSIARWLGL